MTVVDQAIPQRPRVIALGVPYLALAWAVLAATVWGFDDFGPGPWTLTAIWCALLYWVWRGNLHAIAFFSYFLMLVPALLFVGSIMLIASWNINGPPGPVQELPAMLYVGLAGWVGAFVVGLGLRRPEVRAWCLTARRTENRGIAPSHAIPTPAAPEPAAPEPVADEPPAPAPSGPIAPVTFDLGDGLRKQAQRRNRIFAAVLSVLLVFVVVQVLRGADPRDTLPAGVAVGLGIAVLMVSNWRFRRRLGPGAVLGIDARGLSIVIGTERTDLPWTALDGVGISYYVAMTRRGARLHQPQLDIFEDPAYASGRPALPLLETHRRSEAPLTPELPAERMRLMLPITQGLHAGIETAVRGHRPDLWLGWFQRTRSDAPWFLR